MIKRTIPQLMEEAHLLMKMGQMNEAIESFKKVQIQNLKNEDDASSYIWISYCLLNTNRVQVALDELLTGLNKYPNHENILFALSNFYMRTGNIEKSLNILDSIPNSCIEIIGNRLDKLQYYSYNGKEFFEESKKAIRFCDNYSKINRNNTNRIGFISGDFHNHPVGYLSLPIFNSNMYCYYDNIITDSVTRKLQDTGINWKLTSHLSNNELVNLIKKDKIDILIDLVGYSEHNRVGLFSKRVCPIQISWYGWCNTTSIPNVDYKISDIHHVPENYQQFHSEKILYLPDTYILFESMYPNIKPNYKERDYILFGSFNNPSKLNKDVLTAWNRILLNTPNSKLLIKYGSIDNDYSKAIILEYFDNPNQVMFENKTFDYISFLKKYNDVDIILDSFPFSGGMTTLNSLYMSTPVITYVTQLSSGRQSYAYLKNIKCDELIAYSIDEYIEKAIDLGNNKDRIKNYKNTIQTKMINSPLMNKSNFNRNLNSLLVSI